VPILEVQHEATRTAEVRLDKMIERNKCVWRLLPGDLLRWQRG